MEYGITDRKIGDNLTGIAAVNEALTWLGTPCHHQGRIKGVGVDCGTLICEVYEKVGLMDHLDPRPYPPDCICTRWGNVI